MDDAHEEEYGLVLAFDSDDPEFAGLGAVS